MHIPTFSLPKALAGFVAALCLSGISSLAQVDVPANLAASGPLDHPGGYLKGEYWKRPPVSILTDGRANRANGIDNQIRTFGTADGTFKATVLNYTGNDLTLVKDWLGADAASFAGTTNNLDDGAFRFTGYINVPTAGIVSLGLTSDDGSRITIGGLDIAERDGSHGDETQDVDVNFASAGLYPIEITFFNGDWTSDGDNHSGNPDPAVHGGANFHLRVAGGNVTPAQMAMFHPPAPPPVLLWAVGIDDNGWPVGDGGGPNASFVQENGAINPLPGSPTSTEEPRGADNDYYFAGLYTTVIPGNGTYTPVGLVPANEEAAERAFAAADNDLRYHFNLPGSLQPFDQLSVTFDANNLDDLTAVNTDPRYGIEVYINGVLVQPQILIRPAQLGTDYTTPPISLASVNAQVGPGADNIVSLRGINYNLEGGGNWMGIDYVQLNASPTINPLVAIGLNFGADEPAGAGSALAPTDVAGALPQAHWNNLTGASGSAASIVADVAGTETPTTLSVTWTSPNTWSSTGRGEENNGFAAGPDRTLMTGYIDTGNTAANVATVTVSGIPAEYTSGGYDVLVYGLGGVAGRGGAYTIGGETKFGTSPANPAAHSEDAGVDLTDTGTYVKFRGQYGSSFTLVASADPALGGGVNFRAPINAIQIVKSQDPNAGLVKGYLTKRRYENIGNSVLLADLLSHPKYINDLADFTCLRTDFSANDANECNDCGLVVRGFFIPKASGPHTFYISADDGAGLFLSTDENPANKVQIAAEPAWTSRRNYIGGDGDGTGTGRGDPPVNISAPINLLAGNHYYIEGAVKEGGGGDNLDVAVQGPGDPAVMDGDRPIFGDRIATRVDLTGSSLAITQNPVSAQVPEGDPATFTVAVAANSPVCGSQTAYQWQRKRTTDADFIDIPNATSATYAFGPVQVDDHLAVYRAVVTIPGITRTSASATLEVLGRGCLRVVGAVGSADMLHASVQFSTFINLTDAATVDPFSYTIPGLNISAVTLGGDGKSVILTTDLQAEDTPYVVSVAGVMSLVGSPTCEAPDNQATFRSFLRGCGGGILETYPAGGGVAVSGLTSHPSYPNNPDFRGRIDSFDIRVAFDPANPTFYSTDARENYGGRLRGFFIAPESGPHTFYYSSDDNGELWLSTDERPSQKVLIARETVWSSTKQWTASGGGSALGVGGKRSAPINLQAGRAYYMEALYKEGGGGDNAAVAVRLPSQATPPAEGADAIPATLLGAAAPSGVLGQVTVSQQPANQLVAENNPVTFTVGVNAPTIEDFPVPVCYQWLRDGVEISGANGPSYSFGPATLADTGARFQVNVSIIGSRTTSAEATLTVFQDVTPPTCVSAGGGLNLSNIVVQFDELLSLSTASDNFNYTVPGFSIVSATLRPDGKSVLLQVDPALTPDTVYEVTIQNMADLANNPQPAGCTLSFRSFALSCGVVLQELYFGIGGVAVADLRGNAAYPNSPSLVRYKGSLQANTADEFDNYGTRMSGWLKPPVSGNYNFFMSSDDGGEFWLSTDASPVNLVQIASEPVWNGRREWLTLDRRNAAAPENRSTTLFPAGIPLVAGQMYYFEALMKEGGGGDNLAVTWQLPGAPVPAAGSPEIPGAYICSLANPAGASITITDQPDSQSVEENTAANFTVAVNATVGGAPTSAVFYQWYRMTPGGDWEIIPGATAATYAPVVKVADNGNKYRVAISVPGATATSEEATLTAYHRNTAPQFTCGPNQSANEDGGAQTVAGWATGIQPHSIARVPIQASYDFSSVPAGWTMVNRVLDQPSSVSLIRDGILKLTDAINGSQGGLLTTPLPALIDTFTVEFNLRMGGGTCCGSPLPTGDGVTRPADGMSVTIGEVVSPISFPVAAEEGAAVGAGVVVAFDTWDNNGTDEAPAVDVKVGGSVIGFQSLAGGEREGGRPPAGPYITDPATGEPLSFQTGTQFVPVRIHLDPDGTLDVDFRGVRVIDNLQTGISSLANARIAFGARTGGANNNQWVDDLRIEAFAVDSSAEEASQTVQFLVNNDNASLFSVQPSVAPDGTLSYTAAPNACGLANVTVVAKDNGGTAFGGQDTSAPCTFAINVACTNDCPTASPLSVSVDQDGTVNFQLLGSDPEGGVLQYNVAQAPAHGNVTVQVQTGAASYTPTAGYTGPDSFSFTVTDGQCVSAPAVVSITVRESNQAPTAVITATPLADFTPEVPEKLLISCNGSNACLLLDGSLSSDPESPLSALTFDWYLVTPAPVQFASGILATTCLELGTHTIRLVVTDPAGATGSDSLTIEVVSSGEAIEELISKINESSVARKNKRPFIASLKAAAASAERGNAEAAANQLQAFQNKVRAQVSRDNPADAAIWTRWAQQIIDALDRCDE